jgi:phage-related protein
MTTFPVVRPLRWARGSYDGLMAFPREVRRRVGRALWDAQIGRKAVYAKPLKGFAGAGVLEIVADHDGNTYRAVYTVRFSEAVYVLHAFQKKSERGISTPRREVDLIEQRLENAREDYVRWLSERRR